MSSEFRILLSIVKEPSTSNKRDRFNSKLTRTPTNMGNALLALIRGRETLTVDPPELRHRRVKTFSRAIFGKYEWETLKTFCQKYKIRQVDLIRVFQTYLTHDEVYLRNFHIRTIDPRKKMMKYSRLMQELTDIFIPSLYLRNFIGLDKMEGNEEVSFARFIVTSYIIGCEQAPDLIYDFIAILRQKLTLQISAVVTAYSFVQLCTILMEDLQPSGARTALLKGLKKLEEAPDLRFQNIIRMGVKYPLLFYSVERFRKYYKRAVFGDRFWQGRKLLRLRNINLDDHLDRDFNTCFHSEEAALKRTAMSLISDSLNTKEAEWTLNDHFYESPLTINEEQVTILKNILGYATARKMIMESGITGEFDKRFMQPFEAIVPTSFPPEMALDKIAMPPHLQHHGNDHHEEEEEEKQAEGIEHNHPSEREHEEWPEGMAVIHDSNANRDFHFNLFTGRTKWQKIFVDVEGEVLREEFT